MATPIAGAGKGSFGTAAFGQVADPTDKDHRAVMLRRVADVGKVGTVGNVKGRFGSLVATRSGVAWQLATQQGVIYWSDAKVPSAQVIGVEPVSTDPNGAVLGADQLSGGDEFVAWSESDGGRLHDLTSKKLLKLTAYPHPAISGRGEGRRLG